MGNNCHSDIKEDPEERRVNNAINKQIQKEKKQQGKIKLLLLGTGESGKSTFAKQLMIINASGFQKEEERLRYKPMVYSNIVTNMKTLIESASVFNYSLQEENQKPASEIKEIDDDVFRTGESKGLGDRMSQSIKDLWKDDAIQQTYARSAEFQLPDNAEYLFSNIDRIAKSDYIPSQDDILRVRAKTTGINEIEFTIGTYKFSVTDVGGQRSERRKWIHCFEDVTAIIYCAALSEYDQRLDEDNVTNRMAEALKLFGDITNSRWFKNTPIILFLNKRDLFEAKIKKVPLQSCVCFKDYTGGDDALEAIEYIKEKFLSQIHNRTKPAYVYPTIATSTENIKVIFKAVKDIFITVYLSQLGLLGGDTFLGPTYSPVSVRKAEVTNNSQKSLKQVQQVEATNGNNG